VGDGSACGSRSPSGPDIELGLEDALSVFIGLSLALFNLILVPDSLNIRGEWAAVSLGPNEEVLVSGGWDQDDWGRVRVVWSGEGSLWRWRCGSGRGDVSSIMVTVSIITAGSRRAAFKKSGVFVAADRFLILVSGLLSPCINRSIAGDGSGGMNKGGGEFSCSGEGVIPVDPSCRVGDAAGVHDIVEDIGVSVG
jgi:hypothetical protein